MQLGDKITQNIEIGKESKLISTGTVVYIHPLWRFYTLEFELKYGTIRESYLFDRKEVMPVKALRCFH